MFISTTWKLMIFYKSTVSCIYIYTKVTKLFSYIKKIATVFAPTSTHIQIRVYLVR